MKKLLVVGLMSIGFYSFAQCTINGSSTIKVNEQSTYSVMNDNAQCSDCHLWVTVGGNSTVSGDFRKNTITINPTAGGRTVLSLSMLTQQGLVQCSKNIDIIDPSFSGNSKNPATENPNNSVDCDIEVNNFKEVKYAEGVVNFIPNSIENTYKYAWKITYSDGKTMESSEKVPQFPYTKEKSITNVKVKMISSKCIREFSKTYEESFWKFF